MKKNLLTFTLLAGALMVSSCASKKALENCQTENRELTDNYRNAKEQLAASQARVTSLEEQLAQQKKDYSGRLIRVFRIPIPTTSISLNW